MWVAGGCPYQVRGQRAASSPKGRTDHQQAANHAVRVHHGDGEVSWALEKKHGLRVAKFPEVMLREFLKRMCIFSMLFSHVLRFVCSIYKLIDFGDPGITLPFR